MTKHQFAIKTAFFSAITLACVSCQTVRYKFGTENNGDGDRILHHTFVAGLVEHQPLKTKSICKEGVSKITSERSILNFVPFLGFVWLPRSVELECSNVAMGGTGGEKAGNSQNNNQNTNTNTNNITIQISPDMIKKP